MSTGSASTIWPGTPLTHSPAEWSSRSVTAFLQIVKKKTFLPQTEGNSGEFVELVLSGLEYTGPKDLTQYFIRNTSMALGVRNEVEVTVVLGR